MTYQDYFNEINFNEVKQLEEHFEKRQQAIKDKVIELSKCMVNMKVLSKNQGEFYIYRQNLIAEKYNCMKLSNVFLKQLKEIRRTVSKAYKFGEKSAIAKDTSLKLTNNDERDLYFSADLRDYEYRLKVVDDHIQFVVDSTDNIKNMIYGFEMVKELQAYNNSI